MQITTRMNIHEGLERERGRKQEKGLDRQNDGAARMNRGRVTEWVK